MRKGLKASIVTLLSGVMLLGSVPVGVMADTGSKTVKSHPMYRLYNPNSGEHASEFCEFRPYPFALDTTDLYVHSVEFVSAALN